MSKVTKSHWGLVNVNQLWAGERKEEWKQKTGRKVYSQAKEMREPHHHDILKYDCVTHILSKWPTFGLLLDSSGFIILLLTHILYLNAGASSISHICKPFWMLHRKVSCKHIVGQAFFPRNCCIVNQSERVSEDLRRLNKLGLFKGYNHNPKVWSLFHKSTYSSPWLMTTTTKQDIC